MMMMMTMMMMIMMMMVVMTMMMMIMMMVIMRMMMMMMMMIMMMTMMMMIMMMMRKMTRIQIGRMTYIREELERLRQRAELAAEEIHKGTNNLADPEISEIRRIRRNLRRITKP